MESRKRPNEDDAAVSASTESQAMPHSSITTQPPPEDTTTTPQPATEQQEGTKMDIDASSSSEAVPSPTVVAAATMAAKEFSNKRVKLTKEAEKTGSDYSPSGDIPDPATQSTESKGMQEWMNSLDEDNPETQTDHPINDSKDALSSTTKTESLEADKADQPPSKESKDDQSGAPSSQVVGQLQVNPELLREQPPVPSADNTGTPGADSSSGANDLVQALLTPTETSAPTTETAPPAPTDADQTESRGSEISSSILAVASLSDPMVEAATALEEGRVTESESVTKTPPSEDTSKDLIQLLTNPSGTKPEATVSPAKETTPKQATTGVSAAPTQDAPASDSSAAQITPGEESKDTTAKDSPGQEMQVDQIAADESKGTEPTSEPSTTATETTIKSPITRYEGDDVIMTIATGPSTMPSVKTPSDTTGQPPALEATQDKAEADESQQSQQQQQQPEPEPQDRPVQEESAPQRPASPLPSISHSHSLSHSVPRMAASDPNFHERKLSLPETLPPISSLSGAQSLPSLHQPPRSSMSLSAMLINNDEDKTQEQPPRMPRNIFDQPPSSTSSMSTSSPSPLAPTAQESTSLSQKVAKTEPTLRAMPRYSPSGGELTPQQPVDEPRAGGGVAGKEYPADEVMESGGVGGYAGHRGRHGSVSDGRRSPAPGGGGSGGPMDSGHAKLPSLAAISQPHGGPSLHAPSVGPPSGPGQHGGPPPPGPGPGRYMPGYPPSHQGPPSTSSPSSHGPAPLPLPPQHAGHASSHHGLGPHHSPHGGPPPLPPSSQQQQHGPSHHPHHHAANGHGGHYGGPAGPMIPPTSSGSGGPHFRTTPPHQHAQAPSQQPQQQQQQHRPRLIVKNNENLHLPDRPELFLGYYRYEPGVLLPSMEGKENSLLEVRIASSYLTFENAKVRKRNLWGTDIYTDDSDVVAMIIHMGLFIPPLSSQSTQEEQFQPQTQQHNFVEYQAVARHLCPPFDLAVRLRVLPRLVKYQGTIRNRIRSRSWLTNHDGVSLKVESIRQLPLGAALNRGRAQSKKRVQENNAERLRVLADTYDDTTESLQNEKALRAATFEFTQQGDPCFKYTPELVMDRHDGLSRKWTSWRLKKEVMILENDEERYEISLQHQAGTDSRRFDRYRVAVISPRTSLSSRSKTTTYPLDRSLLLEILYEDLDWQDFEWVERGVVIQPDRYGTATTASHPNGGPGEPGQDDDGSAMEGVETMTTTTTTAPWTMAKGGANGNSGNRSSTGAPWNGLLLHKEQSAKDTEYPREEGVFCLVSRLYWRPMSEKRPEPVAVAATHPPAAPLSQPVPGPAPPVPHGDAADKNTLQEPSVSTETVEEEGSGGDQPNSSLTTETSSSSSLPQPSSAPPESTEKNSVLTSNSTSSNSRATGAAAAAPSTTSHPAMDTEKEEGELEEGEVAE